MDRTSNIEQEMTEFVPVTSCLPQSGRDSLPLAGMTSHVSTLLDDFRTLPIFTFFLGNNINPGSGLPTPLWNGYLTNPPYADNSTAAVYTNNGTAAVYADNGTAAVHTNNGIPLVYSNNGGAPLNLNTYRGQGSSHVKTIKLTKKNIIIITATIVTLVVIAITGSLSYYFTKTSDKDVTFYGTLYLNGLDYDENYDNITSSSASQLATRLCDWLMNDVTTRVLTDATFRTCQVTEYSRRRGSVMASFDISVSMTLGIRDKINVLETETIKDMLLAAILTKSEPKVAELDLVITYLNVYKMSLNTTQSPDQTVVSTLSTVSNASTLSTETDTFIATTELPTITTPAGPCSSNPCPAGITCVDIGDDFFCECQVCACTADLVDKTCGTKLSNVTGSCKDLDDGYYPVVTDCTQYLWCYPNGNSTSSCAPGTVFNSNSKSCDKKLACSVNIIRKAPTTD